MIQFTEKQNGEIPSQRTLSDYEKSVLSFKKRKIPTNGVNGVSIFLKLNNFNLMEQVPVEPLHCLSGVIKNRIDILKGNRNKNNNVKLEEIANGRFKHFWQQTV